MAIFNSIVAWLLKKRIHQIELFMKYPHDVQEELLIDLISASQKTEWGKKYDYKSIANRELFRERVPISRYEDLYPYIERMMQGERNILWASKIEWFAKSSGTTNARSKFIPVSPESLEDCHYKAGKDMLTLYVNNFPETNMFTGKSLSIGGTHNVNPSNPKTNYGDVSAVIMQNLPLWAQYIRTPSLKTALLDEWEVKIEQMAHETMQENVTSIAGVPTWTLVLLQRILEISGKENILEVWPDLELFGHGAVSFDPYREIFKKLIPSDSMNYLELYSASEGFIAIQDQANNSDMLLMLDCGIYYEFIPMDQFDEKNPQTITLDQVELHRNYALIMTTNAGLWRYMIGDTVRFVSLNPYRIRITGRTKHYINAFGEELIIENADEGITYACKMTDAVIDNYTAAPIYFSGEQKKENAGHEWLIEFKKEPEDLERFTYFLDKKLKEVNSDYDAKRYQDIALKMPIVRSLPINTFYRWMDKKGKLGGQNKVPRLSNTREYVDDILKIVTN